MYSIGKKFKEECLIAVSDCLSAGYADELTLTALWTSVFSPENTWLYWFLICRNPWTLKLKCWSHQAFYYVLWCFQQAWNYVKLCVVLSNDTVSSCGLATNYICVCKFVRLFSSSALWR